ncbi:MAG: chromosomal replication initiator DnaA, partial [Pseudomonadota bacterium]
AALVLLGREPPSHWTPPLPDLRSRLAVLPIARIERPDDALLRALLHAAFRRRGLAVGDRVVGYLVARMPRDYASVETVAAALDRASLARRSPVTTTLAAALFGWGGSAW